MPEPQHWRKSSYSANSANCVEVGTWRKSSYSGGGGQNCVEARLARDATPRDARNWLSSSHSPNGSNCVESAVVPCGAAVRDSKNPGAGHLAFGAAEWSAFLAGSASDRL